jgi:hypothetical protein
MASEKQAKKSLFNVSQHVRTIVFCLEGFYVFDGCGGC